MITVPIEIGDLAGGHFRELSARVDTGAPYTLIPRRVLRQLGITPIEKLKLESVGGGTVECDFGPARMLLEGSEWVVPVVFGQEEAGPANLSAGSRAGGTKVDSRDCEALIALNGHCAICNVQRSVATKAISDTYALTGSNAPRMEDVRLVRYEPRS